MLIGWLVHGSIHCIVFACFVFRNMKFNQVRQTLDDQELRGSDWLGEHRKRSLVIG